MNLNHARAAAAALMVGAASVSVAVPAAGAVLYFDDFSGAGGPLNGAVPDTRPDGSTATWAAGGTLADSGAVTVDADGATAYLPFVPESGQEYTLSATLLTGATGNNFLGIGFTRVQGNPNFRFFAVPAGNVDPQAVLWGMSRGSNAPGTSFDQSFIGPGTGGGVNATTRSADTVAIVLDTTGANWTVEWYFGAALARTESVAPDAGIQFVALTANNSGGGTWDDFSLTVLPEPAALGVLTLAAGALGMRGRRR